jgi:fatty-acid desaturase
MDSTTKEMLALIGTIFVGLIVIVSVILGLISIPVYYASCRSARVFNTQNNTEYSCGDFFWAVDQINTHTQTIEIK